MGTEPPVRAIPTQPNPTQPSDPSERDPRSETSRARPPDRPAQIAHTQTTIEAWTGPQSMLGECHDLKARSAGLNLDEQAELFRAHYGATGELRANWHKAFTKWLLSGYARSGARSGVSVAMGHIRELEIKK